MCASAYPCAWAQAHLRARGRRTGATTNMASIGMIMKFTALSKPHVVLTATILAALVGCSGGGNDGGGKGGDDDAGVPLAAQTGQPSALFFGNTNYKKLGSAINVRVFDPKSPESRLVSSDDIMADYTGRAQPATNILGYNPADQSYTDLYVSTLYYVKDGSPKRVNMVFGHDMATHTESSPEEQPHSNATGLSSPNYIEVNYLGTQRVLVATDANGQKVIICPSADGSEIAIPFANKTFLTFSYSAYGEKPTAGVVYDATTFKFQKFVPPSEGCAACNEPGTELSFTDYAMAVSMTASSKYTFLGDIGDTATSALIIDGKLYILDKAAMTVTEKTVTPKGTTVTLNDLTTSKAKGAYKFNNDSIYYVYPGADGIANLFRVNVLSGALTQLTKGHGGAETAPSKIHSVTNDWVIIGTDGLMLAAKKDGDKMTPKMLAENTKTSGIRYPFTFGIGDDYLYITYSLDPTTATTTYKACVFDAAGVSKCRENSFWAAVSAKRQGKLNFTSDYPYTPYAYVRVDDTDNFGGGTLKAVDPVAPLGEGYAVGKVAKYNFNTFLHAYYYLKTTVDTDGYLVIYGKNDETFIGDAFLLNLRKANSVVNLTSETEPKAADISTGDLHCHGRYCAICHAYSGGKIYGDSAGAAEALGYSIKFEWSDGTSTLARHGKGMGENFTLPYSSFKGDFTPVIVRAADGGEVKRGQKLGHVGLWNSNCDYCHARGDQRYGSPHVINVAP